MKEKKWPNSSHHLWFSQSNETLLLGNGDTHTHRSKRFLAYSLSYSSFMFWLLVVIVFNQAGATVAWDLTVVGWDVMYKEEFVPEDDCSYKVLLQKPSRCGESIRNSFYVNEPGAIVITIDNKTRKKKRVLYRTKSKPTLPMYIFLKKWSM